MKLFGCRNAASVRKRKQARRESRTILRFASLLSRRIIAGRMLGEYSFSLSTTTSIMTLWRSEVVDKIREEGEMRRECGN